MTVVVAVVLVFNDDLTFATYFNRFTKFLNLVRHHPPIIDSTHSFVKQRRF